MDEQKFLTDIWSGDKDLRFAAWRAAGTQQPHVIAQLGKLAASNDHPGAAKAAREAMTTMVHSVGKDPDAPKRSGVVKELLALTAVPAVNVHALRLLSNIAGEDAVPAIAKHLSNAELREEAIYAIERIPGAASDKALMAAYPSASAEFKPRILAALGHRRTAEATDLAHKEMQSANKEIAIAATKAFARIGRKPASEVQDTRLPDTATEWDRIEHIDSVLRFAEAQVRQGNHADALRIYKTALTKPQEHVQRAAVIGLGKMKTPEAAAILLEQMTSSNPRVRITAINAWKSMA
jgi:HEAT repeat protein